MQLRPCETWGQPGLEVGLDSLTVLGYPTWMLRRGLGRNEAAWKLLLYGPEEQLGASWGSSVVEAGLVSIVLHKIVPSRHHPGRCMLECRGCKEGDTV